MPVVTPAQRLVETMPTGEGRPPNVDAWISQPAGLTQFGALVQVLQPGTRSSIEHWHSDEDELVYLLEGELTLVEGEQETVMRPGDAAAFKAGVPVGHCLWNHGRVAATCLVVGTRAMRDRVTYPGRDRVLHRDRSQPQDTWTDLAGRPAGNPHDDGWG